MKVHKIEIMVIDHDNLGAEQVVLTLEHQKFPNYCISPRVMTVDSRDIEWSDEHPLNNRNTMMLEFERIFDE